jgi:hypothetical protein
MVSNRVVLVYPKEHIFGKTKKEACKVFLKGTFCSFLNLSMLHLKVSRITGEAFAHKSTVHLYTVYVQ